MLVLDIAVVNVGLPSIQEALKFSSGDLQLVVTSYAVTFGGLLLLGGRMADLYRRRHSETIRVIVPTDHQQHRNVLRGD